MFIWFDRKNYMTEIPTWLFFVMCALSGYGLSTMTLQFWEWYDR